MDINEGIQFLTPSFSVNIFKVYPLNKTRTEFVNQYGSSFNYLTSFEDLIHNYRNEFILIKVKIF
jgi:hypothetical protein